MTHISTATSARPASAAEVSGLDNAPGNGDSDVAAGDVTSGRAIEGAMEAMLQAQQQQQQWLWQQQQQFPAFPIRPYGNQYGNFVPNYSFGAQPPVFWDEEEEEEPSQVQAEVLEAKRAEGAERQRQPTHAISDDQDELLEIHPAPTASAAASVAKPEGETAELVKEQLEETSGQEKVGPEVNEDVAIFLRRFLKQENTWAELERLAKTFPRTANVENMRAPRLDEEVFQVVDQKSRNLDGSFQTIQRGVLGVMAAMAPMLDLIFTRGKKDPELDGFGADQIKALKLLGHVLNAVSLKRRELLKPQLAPVYAKSMTKATTETQDGSTVGTWRRPLSSVMFHARLVRR